MSDAYPLKFRPIYKEKIWGGRSLERLFGRELPAGKKIGESWELADLAAGVSVVANGPAAGKTLRELVLLWAADLLGGASQRQGAPANPACPANKFPLLLKLLDANDLLSLQVHPDARAAAEIGPEAVAKTECWYVVESRDGFIYKGLKPGVTPAELRRAIEAGAVEKLVEELVERIDVAAGDFHYLPAGTVHSIGPGLVIAEIQTPSDTTYRLTDWGRGRQIHVERSMQCTRFHHAGQVQEGSRDHQGTPGSATLLETDHFTVVKAMALKADPPRQLPADRCAALVFLPAPGPCGPVGASQAPRPAPIAEISHDGPVEPRTSVRLGDTVLLPACLKGPTVRVVGDCAFLTVTLPERL